MAARIFVIRRNLPPERVFRDRRNPLDWMNEDELYEAYRFRRPELLKIVDELANDVAFDARRQGTLSPVMQVTVYSLIFTKCNVFLLL